MGRSPPPSKKRKKSKKKSKKGGRRKNTSIGLALETTTPRMAATRAQFIYLRHDGISLKEVWDRFRMDPEDDTSKPIRECISFDHLRQLAAKGGWRQQRETMWNGIRSRVLSELQTAAARKELEEIEAMEEASQDAYSELPGTEAKTKEGLISAIVKMDNHVMKKRDRLVNAAAAVSAELDPVSGVSGPGGLLGPELEDDYTEEDIDAMALALAMSRAGVTEEDLREDE